MADKEPWLGSIIKYLAIPLVAIAAIWFLIQQLFGTSKAIETISQSIAEGWDAYAQAFEEFTSPDSEGGTAITPTEQAALDDILNLINQGQQGMENAILDPNKVLMYAITIGGVVTGIYVTVSQLRGALGDRRKAYLDSIRAAWLAPNNYEMTYMATPESLTMAIHMDVIADLADRGLMTEASNAYNALQTVYFAETLPQMQASYNALYNLLPSLTGVQLAMAQMMMAQYSSYLTYYVNIIPPILWMPIPI